MHTASKIFLAPSSLCYFTLTFWGAHSHSRARRCLQPLLLSSYPCALLGSRDSPPHGGDEECWEVVPQPLGQRVTLQAGLAAGSGANPGCDRQLCQTPLWWPHLSCCSALCAERETPGVSRNCGDCSVCSVELPCAYVKGMQSCQGAQAVGVR